MNSLIKYSAIGFLISLTMAVVACSSDKFKAATPSTQAGQQALTEKEVKTSLAIADHNTTPLAPEKLIFTLAGENNGEFVVFESTIDIDNTESTQVLLSSSVSALNNFVTTVYKTSFDEGNGPILTYLVEVKDSINDTEPEVFLYQGNVGDTELTKIAAPDIQALAEKNQVTQSIIVSDLIQWIEIWGAGELDEFDHDPPEEDYGDFPPFSNDPISI